MEQIEITVDIEPEELSDGSTAYVATVRELGVVSQGSTVEDAKKNLLEAVQLFLDTAPQEEIEARLPRPKKRKGAYTTKMEIPFGQTQSLVGA